MLKRILILAGFVICMFAAFQAGVISRDEGLDIFSFDIPVRKLYAEPDERSGVVYDVPVSIDLTGMTADSRWYRIKVSYSFLGYFEYEGWCRVR